MASQLKSRADLVELVKKEMGIDDNKLAKSAIEATIKGITSLCNTDRGIVLQGFGTFEARTRKERKQRNPQTGEIMALPAKRVLTFRMAKSVKDVLNK